MTRSDREDAEWGGAIRRKLGIARGHLSGLAQDLAETGGWEETVKEIRQTLRETADPNPSERHGWEFLAVENQRLQEEVEGLERDSDTLQAAYDAAGISGLQNLAKRITEMREESERLRETLRAFDLERELRARAEQSYAAMREEIVRLRRERDDGHVKTEQLVSCVAESDALREKLAFRVHEPGTFAALQAEVERLRSNSDSLHAAYDAAGISDLQNLAQHIKSMRAERDALLKEKQEVQGT